MKSVRAIRALVDILETTSVSLNGESALIRKAVIEALKWVYNDTSGKDLDKLMVFRKCRTREARGRSRGYKPTKEPFPPLAEGYRFLCLGERVEKGDEFYSHWQKEWKVTQHPGLEVGTDRRVKGIYRRKIES